MALTGCYACMKYLVVIFNLIFWLAGIGVLCVSVWLHQDSSNYIHNSGGNSLYFIAIYILMAAGSLMFIIGLLGCCGALRESPCMLGTFFILLLVIFAADLTGGIWAYMHMDEGYQIIDAEVTNMVKNEYGHSKALDRTIDSMQHDLGCCGAKRPSDWAHSRLNTKHNSAPEVGISESSGFYMVPATCCKTKIPEDCEFHRKVKFAGQSFDGLYNEGCANKLKEYLSGISLILLAIGIGVGVIQILGLIFSMTLCCAIRKDVALSSA